MLFDQGSFRSKFRRLIALCALVFAIPQSVFAQTPAEPPAPAPSPNAAAAAGQPKVQRKVAVGILLNRIEKFSLKDNEFLVSFYVWFRWSGDDFKPIDSMEVVNGHIESKDISDEHDLPDGKYSCYLVRATINQEFDLTRYPLERHDLVIEIEDAVEDARVLYVADNVNSGLGDSFRVPGFRSLGANFNVVTHRYKTNYGDTSLPTGAESTYSRFVATVKIERPSTQFAFKLFISLYIAAFIALLAMWVSPDFLDPRLGLGVAAVFAAVGSQFVISSNLPETDQVTLADKAAMLAIFLVFLTLAESILVYVIAKKGREATAIRVDRIAFFVLLGVYGIANWVIAR